LRPLPGRHVCRRQENDVDKSVFAKTTVTVEAEEVDDPHALDFLEVLRKEHFVIYAKECDVKADRVALCCSIHFLSNISFLLSIPL
jgi:hypothetical protein